MDSSNRIMYIVVGVFACLTLVLFMAFKVPDAQIGSAPYYSGTTGSIGGGALLVGQCATGTASVANASTGQPVSASPSDGTNIMGTGVDVMATVTANGTVTVNVCAIIAVTPAAKTYNVRVFP